MLREESRELYPEFVKLLPSPPPIRIQRWSIRRVGLWAAIVLLLVLVALNPTAVFDNRMALSTPLNIHSLGCAQLEPLWLQAQSVPSATLVPCVRSRLPGWSVANVAVNDGRSVITLDHDRAGKGAVVVRLATACDPAGAVEVPSQEPGVRRAARVERLAAEFSATWYDRFPGGCVTYRLHSTSDLEGQLANETPSLLGFTTRAALRQALDERSDGRLQLDPRRSTMSRQTRRCRLVRSDELDVMADQGADPRQARLARSPGRPCCVVVPVVVNLHCRSMAPT
jgi:hypothetical protein